MAFADVLPDSFEIRAGHRTDRQPLAVIRPFVLAVLLGAGFGPAIACVQDSARHHGVDARLLQALVAVDQDGQRLDDRVLAAGTVRHVGSTCGRTEAAAAALARQVAQHGTNWPALGALFSPTTYYAYRAQTLLFNRMLAAGAVQGQAMQVPSLRPSESPWAPGVGELDVHLFVFSDLVH